MYKETLFCMQSIFFTSWFQLLIVCSLNYQDTGNVNNNNNNNDNNDNDDDDDDDDRTDHSQKVFILLTVIRSLETYHI